MSRPPAVEPFSSADKSKEIYACARPGIPWVEEKLSSTSMARERYRTLFGIDPYTLERVDR